VAERVLIVDDSPFIRLMLRNLLVANGYEVAGEAADGKAAVEAFAALRPDLVTLDLVMPVLDGLGALKGIRAVDPAARVIMMTSEGQVSTVQEALRGGAVGYLVKPFKERALLDAIRGRPPAPAKQA
jgi:two-component system chemotaxis response regulator CheY